MEIKDYNDIIDGRKLFGQSIKSDLKTCDNIRKIVIGQGLQLLKQEREN